MVSSRVPSLSADGVPSFWSPVAFPVSSFAILVDKRRRVRADAVGWRVVLSPYARVHFLSGFLFGDGGPPRRDTGE